MRCLFTLCFMLILLFACTDDYNNPIPSRRVYLDLDLTYKDKILQGATSYKIYTPKNIIAGKEYIGYAGVLVTNSIFGGYKAFDIACPNETRLDAVIEIDNDNNAVCKVCGSKYEVILNQGSGICIEGPSKYPLRQYMTSLKNKTLIISN